MQKRVKQIHFLSSNNKGGDTSDKTAFTFQQIKVDNKELHVSKCAP